MAVEVGDPLEKLVIEFHQVLHSRSYLQYSVVRSAVILSQESTAWENFSLLDLMGRLWAIEDMLSC